MGFGAGWLLLLLVTALLTEDIQAITRQDVNSFIQNRAFMSGLFSCLMNNGPCNFITQKIKGRTHDALHGRCRGCSREDRHLMLWTIKKVRRNYPNEFRQVWRRYY